MSLMKNARTVYLQVKVKNMPWTIVCDCVRLSGVQGTLIGGACEMEEP